MPEIIERSVEESIKDSFFSNPNRTIDNLLNYEKSKEKKLLNNDLAISKRLG